MFPIMNLLCSATNQALTLAFLPRVLASKETPVLPELLPQHGAPSTHLPPTEPEPCTGWVTYSCRWPLLSGEGNSPWCILGPFAHHLYVISDEHLPTCFSFKSTLFFNVKKNFKGNFKSVSQVESGYHRPQIEHIEEPHWQAK